ncbi:MAG: NCS2 family permease [Planctomycetota bacterium]
MTLFKLKENGTTVGVEAAAGVSTFLAMSYIIFVQPAILGGAGTEANPLDAGAVMVATCLASAVACFAMGLLANYPIALAPGMGHNAIFAFTICGAMGLSWQQALAATFISGAIFVVLCWVPFREKVLEMLPQSLSLSIGAGIGLLITLVGLEYGGIIVNHPATLVTLGDLGKPGPAVALLGLLVAVVLMALKFRGAILVSVAVAAAAGWAGGLVDGSTAGEAASLSSLGQTAGAFWGGMRGLTDSWAVLLEVIGILLFLDVFDTVGTLVGVGTRAGFIEDDKLPRARWAFLSDALGTVVGAVLGTSTVTSYVESSAGVQAGGRTGLANMVTGGLFLLSLAALPLLGYVTFSVEMSDGQLLYPAIAPALIVVGAMMMQNVGKIDWEDPTEYLPAFLTLVIIPLSFSITHGIVAGVVAYAILKLVTRRTKEAHWGLYILAGLCVLWYIFLGTRLGG